MAEKYAARAEREGRSPDAIAAKTLMFRSPDPNAEPSPRFSSGVLSCRDASSTDDESPPLPPWALPAFSSISVAIASRAATFLSSIPEPSPALSGGLPCGQDAANAAAREDEGDIVGLPLPPRWSGPLLSFPTVPFARPEELPPLSFAGALSGCDALDTGGEDGGKVFGVSAASFLAFSPPAAAAAASGDTPGSLLNRQPFPSLSAWPDDPRIAFVDEPSGTEERVGGGGRPAAKAAGADGEGATVLPLSLLLTGDAPAGPSLPGGLASGRCWPMVVSAEGDEKYAPLTFFAPPKFHSDSAWASPETPWM